MVFITRNNFEKNGISVDTLKANGTRIPKFILRQKTLDNLKAKSSGLASDKKTIIESKTNVNLNAMEGETNPSTRIAYPRGMYFHEKARQYYGDIKAEYESGKPDSERVGPIKNLFSIEVDTAKNKLELALETATQPAMKDEINKRLDELKEMSKEIEVLVKSDISR